MKVKVCLIQDAPVFFDKEASLQKLTTLVEKYSAEADLIVFPESFIPGYPRGFSFGAKVGRRSDEGKALYAEYVNNSIDLGGVDRKRLEELSKSNNTYLVIGATEKESQHGSLYCSMIYISPTQGLLGVHRKIKPTGTERVIWSEAAGESLVTFDTSIGKLGGLICWENYMPLARMSMYQKGVEIYLAPTADSRPSWTSTMQHIAMEGRCFVLGCNQYFTKSMYPKRFHSQIKDEEENMCEGGSIIVSPIGEILAGPLFGSAGALLAELDLEEVSKSKLGFDVVGHYSRKDIFNYSVNGQPEILAEEE